MRIPGRVWRRFGAALLVLAAVLVVVKVWVIPTVLAGQIEARFGGHASLGGWWAGASSAGVTHLALHEGPDAGSPVWFEADTVSTDLSLGGLLAGRFTPGRVELVRPRLTFRVDREGKLLTPLPSGGDGPPSALPEVVVDEAIVSFHQEGRPEMVVTDLDGSLTRDDEGAAIEAKAIDPNWGRLVASGRLGKDLDSVDLTLRVDGLDTTPAKARSIPFVPEATWEHVRPTGPIGAVVRFEKPSASEPLTVGTLLTYQGTSLDLPTLGIEATAATGRMRVDGALVSLDGMTGRTLDGALSADGSLDFRDQPPRFDLTLHLDDVNVADAPASWDLREAGLTGKLTGEARLKVALTDEGADLTGSTGDAVLKGGTLGDIPVESLRLQMTGEGQNLRYDTGEPSDASTFLRTIRPLGWPDWALLPVVALQDPAGNPPAADRPRRGLILPRSISTELELKDVDLKQVVAKVESYGIKLPFEAAGRLSVEAKATIPLGRLAEIRAYAFHGRATLEGAHIAGVDLGRVTAALDLEDGVLELTDFQGQFVDRPAGRAAEAPTPTAPIPPDAPLPPGGFRGRLRAELDPKGGLTAHLEGVDLPMAELLAPAFEGPTPVAGALDLTADVGVDLDRATDPKAWDLDARVASHRATYRGSTLDEASATVQVRDGTLTIDDLAARLEGQPLSGGGTLGLAEPYPYRVRLDVEGWDLDSLLALIPGTPQPSPLHGKVEAEANAEGTLEPWHVASNGSGRLAGFRAGPVALGDVPVRWATAGDAIAVDVVEARPFGGRLSAQARVPTDGGPIVGLAAFQGIDASAIAEVIPGESIALSGRADGRARFSIRPQPAEGQPPVEADVRVEANDLAVQGIPATGVQAAVRVDQGRIRYDLYAETLGGKASLKGSVPLWPEANAADANAPEVEAELLAVGFSLRDDLWSALGATGAIARIEGQGAIKADVALDPEGGDLRARGSAEFRDLRYGPDDPVGRLRGDFAAGPAGWEIRPITGELFGGPASGSIVATAPTTTGPDQPADAVRFNVQLDRASLDRLAALVPTLAGLIEGDAVVRLTGRLGEILRAEADVRVDQGQVAGLPLRDLQAPAEVIYVPNSSSGTLRARRFQARLAGGRVDGSMLVRFGNSRAFESRWQLGSLELETLSRIYTDARRPASGKVSGVVVLSGLDTSRPETYQGRADLELADAAVLDLPVFRALDRFLGGPAGGIFEQGELHAGIGNRRILVERLDLLGRVAQLHAEGTVGFDGSLELIVLINTNQIIPQTGQALVALIPGLAGARGGQATSSVSSFLSNRLLKIRVGGTLRSPSVSIDPTVTVTNAAVGFFAGALKLPLGLLR